MITKWQLEIDIQTQYLRDIGDYILELVTPHDMDSLNQEHGGRTKEFCKVDNQSWSCMLHQSQYLGKRDKIYDINICLDLMRKQNSHQLF